MQGDLCDHTEAVFFRHTVGHVEIEALVDGDLTVRILILPAAVHLLQGAQALYPDTGVAFAALGLAEVGKH